MDKLRLFLFLKLPVDALLELEEEALVVLLGDADEALEQVLPLLEPEAGDVDDLAGGARALAVVSGGDDALADAGVGGQLLERRPLERLLVVLGLGARRRRDREDVVVPVRRRPPRRRRRHRPPQPQARHPERRLPGVHVEEDELAPRRQESNSLQALCCCTLPRRKNTHALFGGRARAAKNTAAGGGGEERVVRRGRGRWVRFGVESAASGSAYVYVAWRGVAWRAWARVARWGSEEETGRRLGGRRGAGRPGRLKFEGWRGQRRREGGERAVETTVVPWRFNGPVEETQSSVLTSVLLLSTGSRWQ